MSTTPEDARLLVHLFRRAPRPVIEGQMIEAATLRREGDKSATVVLLAGAVELAWRDAREDDNAAIADALAHVGDELCRGVAADPLAREFLRDRPTVYNPGGGW